MLQICEMFQQLVLPCPWRQGETLQDAYQASGVGSRQVDVVRRRPSGFGTQCVGCPWTRGDIIRLMPGLSFLCGVEGKGYRVSTWRRV